MNETSSAGPRVVVAGWYGATNFGDELLLAQVVDWIRAGGGVPVAFSVNPANTRRVHGIDAVALGDLPGIVEAMLAARLFLFGGGGLLQNYDALDPAHLGRFPAHNATLYAQYFFLAKELGLVTAVLAQGVGPLFSEGARRVAADVLRAADYVSMRDDASASLARDVGVDRRLPVAPDPGWSAARRLARLDLPAIDPALAGKRVLAVNLRRWPFDADWEERFANAFRGALPDGWVALWIDFQRTPNDDGSGYVDDEIASRMIQRLAEPGRHVLLAPANMREAMDALVSCDAVLGMRLHAALLGVAAGLPVLSLEYDDKVGAMMAQAGLPAAQRIALPEIAPRLRGALHALIGHGSRPMTPSPEVRLQLAEAALLHRDILWQAMQAARARTPPAAIAMPPILSQWLDAQPALAPAIRSVLGSRVA